MKLWVQRGRALAAGKAYEREVRSGAAGMASQRGGLCVGVQASEGVDRILGTLPDLIWQVEPALGTLRKDGWASGRGGVPAMGTESLLQPSRKVVREKAARGSL